MLAVNVPANQRYVQVFSQKVPTPPAMSEATEPGVWRRLWDICGDQKSIFIFLSNHNSPLNPTKCFLRLNQTGELVKLHKVSLNLSVELQKHTLLTFILAVGLINKILFVTRNTSRSRRSLTLKSELLQLLSKLSKSVKYSAKLALTLNASFQHYYDFIVVFLQKLSSPLVSFQRKTYFTMF